MRKICNLSRIDNIYKNYLSYFTFVNVTVYGEVVRYV